MKPRPESSPRTVRIPADRCGYPGVAFGGSAAGLVATPLGADVAHVRFRRPTPVERDLRVHVGDGRSELQLDGDVLITAERTSRRLPTPPPAPTVAEAREAMRAYPGVGEHRQPQCFGCGPACPPDRGLRIFTAPVDGRALVAAAWMPPAWSGGRHVAPEMVWAALDCPGAWAALSTAPMRGHQVTAEMTCRPAVAPVTIGIEHVVIGWLVAAGPRDRTVGAAIFTREGELCAQASARWVALDRPLTSR